MDRDRPQVTTSDPEHDHPSELLEAARAFFGGLDVVIGVLLAVMLLPLILGPIVVAYQFIQAGQYVEAGAIAALAIACYGVTGRAVRRGEFGPATVFTVLAIGAIIFYVAIRFRR